MLTMEITGKVLREVEFRDRLRGYDFEEVDEFLEQVAVAIDSMQAELSAHRESLKSAEDRVQKAESLIKDLESRPIASDSQTIDDEGIRKTLMLAQRTADMAIAEARAEADKLVAAARSEAEKVLFEADDYVKSMKTEAEKGLSARIASLTDQHDQLMAEIKVLNQVLKAERTRLTEALNSALRFVTQAFPMNETIVDIEENGRATIKSLIDPSESDQSLTASVWANDDESAFNDQNSDDSLDLSDENNIVTESSSQIADDENHFTVDQNDTYSDESNAMAESEDNQAIVAEAESYSKVEEKSDIGSLYNAIDIKNEVISDDIAVIKKDTDIHNNDAQRDDGLVDSLLQDMFESLGQENDDVLWARFTSSSLDVNVIKSADNGASTQYENASNLNSTNQETPPDYTNKDQHVTGEVLQFERNKKQDD